MSWKISARSARFITGGLIASLASFGPVRAQEATPTPSEQIAGLWSVVSVHMDQRGRTVENFGENPNGIISFDSGGYFVGVIQSRDLPPIASNNRMLATGMEGRAITRGSLAYFGKYTVDAKREELNLHFLGCTYPNWVGMDQTRTFTIKGTELDLTVPVTTAGPGVAHLVLKRLE